MLDKSIISLGVYINITWLKSKSILSRRHLQHFLQIVLRGEMIEI